MQSQRENTSFPSGQPGQRSYFAHGRTWGKKKRGDGPGEVGVWERIRPWCYCSENWWKLCGAFDFPVLPHLFLQGFLFLSHVPNSWLLWVRGRKPGQALDSEDTVSPLAVLPLWRISLVLASGCLNPFLWSQILFFSCLLCHPLIWCVSLDSEASRRWWHDWLPHWPSPTEVVLLSKQPPEGNWCQRCDLQSKPSDMHSGN